MTHFTDDNTAGYTETQLAEANANMDAWCERYSVDPVDGTSEYKAACERALYSVEVHS